MESSEKDTPAVPTSLSRTRLRLLHPGHVWAIKDGSEIDRKTSIMAFNGAVAGFGLSFSKYYLIEKAPHMFRTIASNMTTTTFSLAMAGALYAQAANRLALYRGKDDDVNHLVAGFVAGSVYAFKHASIARGINMGLFFGISGSLIKKLYMHFPSTEERRKLFKPSVHVKYPILNRAERQRTFPDTDY